VPLICPVRNTRGYSCPATNSGDYSPLTESGTLTISLKRKAIYPDTQNAKDNKTDRDNSSSNNNPRGVVFPRNIIRGSRFGLISDIDSPLSSIESVIPAIPLEERSARPKGTPSIYNEIEIADNIFSTPDTQIANILL
jgi:hypothetical protein